MAKSTKGYVRLPNAPLTEVVFELRWKLQGAPPTPPPLYSDPGASALVPAFTTAMAKKGFPAVKDMSSLQETGAHGVARRLYRARTSRFHLFKLGLASLPAMNLRLTNGRPSKRSASWHYGRLSKLTQRESLVRHSHRNQSSFDT
jgi:hypothetical protein